MPEHDTPARAAATIADYLRVLRRRWWLVLVAAVVAPAAAYAVTSRQDVHYQASAQVLLLTAGSALPTNSPSLPSVPNTPATQTVLARSPAIAQQAIDIGHLPLSPGAFLAATSIDFSSDGNIVDFSASTKAPELAPQLANAYARAYIHYRYTSQTSGLETLRKTLEARLAASPSGAVRGAIGAQLQAIETQEAVHTADARLFQRAEGAATVEPPTRRNTAIGLALGLVLGIGLAFLLEALDTRIRSSDVVEERLGLPLLGRLPAPSRSLRRGKRLAMLDKPGGPQAEALRILRTNLEFAMLGRDIRSVMVTSAIEEEGKSTTIANLAVAFARVGRRVTIVDLDLRRPYLHRFFDVGDRPGLTEVVLGHASLDQALVPLDVDAEVARSVDAARSNGWAPRLPIGTGAPLHVLTLGPIPPDPGEFVGSQPLAALLEHLRSQCDLLFIDAPPLFHVGDGLTLSARVDAALVITNLGMARRHGLVRLRRLLDSMPARKLGFVVTGVANDDGYGYGAGGYYAYPPSHAEAARQ
ncbi:MAG TPA: division plane positioning ATPase MipZ [Gaiellaceae bacterium]|nr:division plane positioning ATPase MipZ [Gaiellaceae bacterium]